MKKILILIMAITMIGMSLGVGAAYEPVETTADEIYSEFSEYSEDEAEPTNENVPIAAASTSGHVLDLSDPPTATSGVWEVTDLLHHGITYPDSQISYIGTEPLTITGNNSGTPLMIVVTTATRVYVENNTFLSGSISFPPLGNAGSTTLHGLGSNITLQAFWNTSSAVISSRNLTISGEFGSMAGEFFPAIIVSNGNLNISTNIRNITQMRHPASAAIEVSPDHNIYISSPITVAGGRAFSQQPVITLPHTATWSNNMDGSDATSGSPYVWSEDHRWVRIEILDNVPITATDPGTGIGLVAEPGVVPYGTTMQVDRITEGDDFTMITNALAQTSGNFVAFDIKLLFAGAEIQPNGNVTITIPKALWQDFVINRLAVYHIAPDGTLTRIPHRMGEGNESIIFDTDRFSFFAVVELPYVPGAGAQVLGESDVPQTGDSANMLLWISLLSLSVLGITLAVIWQKKRQNSKS